MPNTTLLGKAMILSGFVLLIAGFVLLTGKEIPLLSRMGRLPGDIRIQKEGFSFYFPITTCILMSTILTLISLFFRWMMKR